MNNTRLTSILRFFVVLMICITASYAICYTAIQYFSEQNTGGNLDALKYLAMYRGESVAGHWRFRIFTPFLARILPNPPRNMFDSDRNVTDLWISKIKFGFVNFCFLSLAGVLFFYYLNKIGLSIWESLFGITLFYTARPVIHSAGIPLVDASSYFFLLLCLYAILCQNLLILIMGFSVGIFAKESILLIVPVLLLSQFKHKWRAIFLLIPGIIAYIIFRFYLYPTSGESYFNLIYIKESPHKLMSMVHFNKIVELFSSFGLLWVPALYALAKGELPILLRHWAFMLILFLLMIVPLSLDGRHLFLAFPFVIPLAVYGLGSMLMIGQDK